MVDFILTTLNAIASDNDDISRADHAIVMDYLPKNPSSNRFLSLKTYKRK